MGFPIVEIRMPEYDGEAEARFGRWLVPAGELIDWDKPIADILVNGELNQLICNMPVVLEETAAESGCPVRPSQPLARAFAEGHEIPYGRPYARLEKVV